MSKYIVIANWKMNPETFSEAKQLFSKISGISRKLKKTDVVVCPPFPFLSSLKPSGKKTFLGAQDTFFEEKGSFTGETSPTMLKSLGTQFVIVGHSERRSRGETDTIVNKKIVATLKSRMTPIVCIGESIHDNHGNYLTFLREQLKNCFAGVSKVNFLKTIIAYEPIWAIGKTADDAMDPRTLHETVLYIQKVLSEQYGRSASQKVRIIYGASVEPENARNLIKDGNVVGLLVGHASLSSQTFGPLLTSVDSL